MDKTFATGDEVDNVLRRLEPVLVGLPKYQVLAACLSLAFILQYPEIEVSELAEGVSGASKWITGFLQERYDSSLPPEKLN